MKESSNENLRAELEAMKQEIERLKSPKPSLSNTILKGFQNTTKSPVSTLVSIIFSAPLIYKGVQTNDNSIISLGVGLITNGMFTNEKPPENPQQL